MKKKIIQTSLLTLMAVTAIPAIAQQPGTELVDAAVSAYNGHDLSYFEQRLTDDVVWLDEDGHIMNGKSTVLSFLRLQFNQTPRRTLSVSNVQVNGTTDAVWATFEYMIMGGDAHIMGLNTTVFRRVDDDWRIALVHGAFNAESHH